MCVISETIISNVILPLLVLYYDNYTTNYNQWIRINYLSGSILLQMGCEDKLSLQQLHLIILFWVWAFFYKPLTQILVLDRKCVASDGLCFDLDCQVAGTAGSCRLKGKGVTAASCHRAAVMISIWSRLALWLRHHHWVRKMFDRTGKLSLKALKAT